MISLKEFREGELFGPGSWKTVGGFLNNSFTLVWMTCLAWYVGYVFFYAPSHDLGKKDLAKVQKAKHAVELQIAAQLPNADILFKPLKGSNVDICLAKSSFESIAYPDREDFVSEVGKSWCDHVEHTFMPSVKIKDIANGETMGKYNCFSIVDL